MEGHRVFLSLLVLVGLVAFCGSSCPRLVPHYAEPLPRVLPPSPSLEQVIQVVNQNSSQIVSIEATQATLSSPGLPTLRADVAFQRPKRFRLRAQMVMAPEIDLGSNDELFWFWIRRNEPPAVYFCRHQQFAGSRAAEVIPIDPDWLIESLGIVEFDPALPHQGPFPLPGDRLEVRTIRETARGPTTKVTVIDGARGLVLQQQVYDVGGRLRASAVARRHRRDPLTGLILPRTVDICCPATEFSTEFSMRIDLGNARINSLTNHRPELWTMPSYDGYPVVDLCNPGPPASRAAVSAR